MTICNPVQLHRRSKTIGMIAGWGRFPIIVAESLRASGHQVVCCGVKGHAAKELESICNEFRWFGMARMGSQLRYFKRHNVEQATMAGKIFKTLLFKKFHLLQHLPDWKSICHLYPVYISKTKDRKDDTLLTIVTELFQSGGVTFSPATDFAPELLVNEGILTKRSPTKNQLADVQFAWETSQRNGAAGYRTKRCR